MSHNHRAAVDTATGHLLCCCLTACLPVQFCDMIKSYPLQPLPEIFGLHVNADITCQQAETYELLATVLGLQPRTSSSSSAADSQEAVVARVAKSILDKVGSLGGCAHCSNGLHQAHLVLTPARRVTSC